MTKLLSKTATFSQWCDDQLAEFIHDDDTIRAAYASDDDPAKISMIVDKYHFVVDLPTRDIAVLNAHPINPFAIDASTLYELTCAMNFIREALMNNEKLNTVRKYAMKNIDTTCDDCLCHKQHGHTQRGSSYLFPYLDIVLCEHCLERANDILMHLLETTTAHETATLHELRQRRHARFQGIFDSDVRFVTCEMATYIHQVIEESN